MGTEQCAVVLSSVVSLVFSNFGAVVEVVIGGGGGRLARALIPATREEDTDRSVPHELKDYVHIYL